MSDFFFSTLVLCESFLLWSVGVVHSQSEKIWEGMEIKYHALWNPRRGL